MCLTFLCVRISIIVPYMCVISIISHPCPQIFKNLIKTSAVSNFQASFEFEEVMSPSSTWAVFHAKLSVGILEAIACLLFRLYFPCFTEGCPCMISCCLLTYFNVRSLSTFLFSRTLLLLKSVDNLCPFFTFLLRCLRDWSAVKTWKMKRWRIWELGRREMTSAVCPMTSGFRWGVKKKDVFRTSTC